MARCFSPVRQPRNVTPARNGWGIVTMREPFLRSVLARCGARRLEEIEFLALERARAVPLAASLRLRQESAKSSHVTRKLVRRNQRRIANLPEREAPARVGVLVVAGNHVGV